MSHPFHTKGLTLRLTMSHPFHSKGLTIRLTMSHPFHTKGSTLRLTMSHPFHTKGLTLRLTKSHPFHTKGSMLRLTISHPFHTKGLMLILTMSHTKGLTHRLTMSHPFSKFYQLLQQYTMVDLNGVKQGLTEQLSCLCCKSGYLLLKQSRAVSQQSRPHLSWPSFLLRQMLNKLFSENTLCSLAYKLTVTFVMSPLSIRGSH